MKIPVLQTGWTPTLRQTCIPATAALCIVVRMMLSGVSNGAGDTEPSGVRDGLQTFEMFGLLVAIYYLVRCNWRVSRPWNVLSVTGAAGLSAAGFHGIAITALAVTLRLAPGVDAARKAAAAILMAIAVQGVWAPLLFAHISQFLLPLDAAAAGSILSLLVPGVSWDHTIITAPSGFGIDIVAGCSSIHNLSLAALCWVTMTMLQRPYWTRYDLFVGLATGLVQIAANVTRLMIVSLSASAFDFWHDGVGRHFFAAAATFAAIVIAGIGASWASDRARPSSFENRVTWPRAGS
jgi:exosortase/archaeosortase family protein